MTEPSHNLSDIPAHVVEFFCSLDKEEILEIKEAMKFARDTKTVGKFLRACFYTVAAVFIMTAAFGDSLGKIANWFNPWRAP